MSKKTSMESAGKENSRNSLIPLYLFMILKEESSAEKPLTRTDITKLLAEDKYGIEVGEEDRKTIPRCVRTLIKYFPGAIVENEGKKGAPTSWYLDAGNTPLLGGEVFSAEEASIFIEMISGLKIISNECTSSLIAKLIAATDEAERERLGKTPRATDGYKCENKKLLEIKGQIEKAIEYYREITLTYKIDGEEQEFTVIPHTVQIVNGEVFLDAFYKTGGTGKFYLDRITSLSVGKEAEEIYGDDGFDLEPEASRISKSIALDMLFSNLKKINYAIKNRQTLKFNYLGYSVKGNRVELESKAEDKDVFPVNTAFKNEKYYLIARDLQSDCKPVFYRLDLITDLEYGSVLDFMERRRLEARETRDDTDSHPYMLPGFTRMGVRFLIETEALDRVFDAFGNKAIPCGEVWGYQTAGENARKLAEKYPELNFSTYLGLEHNRKYAEFKVETTDEDAFRFAMANADVVELLAPTHLRERILDVSRKVEKRYSKVKR